MNNATRGVWRLILLAVPLLLALGALGVMIRNWRARQDAAAAVHATARRNIDESERAVRFFEERARSDPQGATGIAMLASAYLKRFALLGDEADRVRAESSARRSLTVRSKNNPIAVDALARALMGRHAFADALTVASGRSPVIEAECLLELGRNDESRSALARAESPDSPDVQALAGRLWLLEDRPELARRSYDDAMKAAQKIDSLPPATLAWFYVQRARCSLARGDHAAARADRDIALELAPDDVRALLFAAQLALCDREAGRAKEWAQQAYDRSTSLEAGALLSDARDALGEKDSAATMRTRLIEIGPASGHERAFATFLADHEERLDDAVRLATLAQKARPTRESDHALAWCLLQNKKPRDAAVALGTVDLQCPDASRQFLAGEIAAASGDSAGARAHLERALAIDPQFHYLYADRARADLAALPKATL